MTCGWGKRTFFFFASVKRRKCKPEIGGDEKDSWTSYFKPGNCISDDTDFICGWVFMSPEGTLVFIFREIIVKAIFAINVEGRG